MVRMKVYWFDVPGLVRLQTPWDAWRRTRGDSAILHEAVLHDATIVRERSADMTPVFDLIAAEAALSVAHLWLMPEAMREYLVGVVEGRDVSSLRDRALVRCTTDNIPTRAGFPAHDAAWSAIWRVETHDAFVGAWRAISNAALAAAKAAREAVPGDLMEYRVACLRERAGRADALRCLRKFEDRFNELALAALSKGGNGDTPKSGCTENLVR